MSNAGGSDTAYGGGPVVVTNPRPIANFTGTPRLGSVPLKVQFTDTSTSFPTTWRWDFGDNTFELDIRNPVHTYNKAGSYNVTLIAMDARPRDSRNSTLTRPAYITATNTPFAEFTASPTSGTVPLFVTFHRPVTGQSTPVLLEVWRRDLLQCEEPHTLLQETRCIHRYPYGPEYCWRNTIVKENLITVTELPQAGFVVNATSGMAPKTIRFTDTSTGVPDAWNWDFGDGSPGSAEQNPVHTYYSSGLYSVQLIVFERNRVEHGNKALPD